MATRKDTARLRQIGALFNVGAIRELTDGQLLERFATEPGEVAELAFAALVERHGPMVRRVCRALLGDPHDAQDAFQATFLVLVKKARGLWVRDSLGPWLHQVAVRTAQCARTAAARRRHHERRAAESVGRPGAHPEPAGFEWASLLHTEIDRLPERYRVPIVLCDLEGHTCEEAARRMGRPVGTVKSWRARGRERLRTRLMGRGLASVVGLEAALTAAHVSGAVTWTETDAAVRSAIRAVSGDSIATELSAAVWLLTKGVLREMLIQRLRTIVAAVLALGILAAGVGAVVKAGTGGPREEIEEPAQPPTEPAAEPPVKPSAERAGNPDEPWPLSLRDAIRLGLECSSSIRVVESSSIRHAAKAGKPSVSTCTIVSTERNADPWRFRKEAMARVRAIEQRYWSLVQEQAKRRATEKEIRAVEDTLATEQSALENGPSNGADIAETQQRLEQFRLDLATKTADAATAERQLKEVLGLAIVDVRHIRPITLPLAAKVSVDWDKCLATWLERNPELALAKQDAKKEGLTDAEAADLLRAYLPFPEGFIPGVTSRWPDRRGPRLSKESPALREVVQREARKLLRCFLEIPSSFKQYEIAAKFRVSAGQRFVAQRAFYGEGRITVDRYLDALSQYYAAIMLEEQYKISYNLSFTALAEARGTLLEDDGIVVVEAGRRLDPFGAPTSAGPYNGPATNPAPVKLVPVQDSSRPEEGGGKTYSFQTTLGFGRRPFTIRGSITLPPAPAKADGDDR